MWLLSTDRAELHYFSNVEATLPKGYAILSHVWDEQEQSFNEIQRLQAQCEASAFNPRDRSSRKIRESCILAERHGFHWIWIDTCCIDKTSSAELSEAINSMFSLYSRASICYAYLRDVLATCALDEHASSFRESCWFTRGWTLQELIAPDEVVFLSQDWDVLGTKADLAELLQEITQIPIGILRLERYVTDYSVAQRMSWAAHRKTSRLEDEAYCLLGIFDVNMPTIYGEGRRAFQRLQEEIMKKTVDTTLFAWGDATPICPSTFFGPSQHSERQIYPEKYLFAPSPAWFQSSGDLEFRPDTLNYLKFNRKKNSLTVELERGELCPSEKPMLQASTPTFTITSRGVRATIPVIEVSTHVKIAILFASRGNRKYGLVLGECPSSQSLDPSRQLYHCCREFCSRPVRLVCLAHVAFAKAIVRWQELYLTHQPPASRLSPALLMNRGLRTPFRIDQQSIQELAKEGLLISMPSELPFPWRGDPPVALTIVTGAFEDVQLAMGLCFRETSPKLPAAGSEPVQNVYAGTHWVRLSLTPRWKRGLEESDSNVTNMHDCSNDHVDTRLGPRHITLLNGIHGQFLRGTKRVLTLSLIPYPLNPEGTYVITLHVS